MKQRLVVMNGSKIVMAEQNGAWTNYKVEKAGGLKPGIYNLYMAKEAEKTKRYDGVIVHADSNKLYQQNGKAFTMHSKADFDIVPEVGGAKSISYDAQGKAVVAQSAKLSRGRSR